MLLRAALLASAVAFATPAMAQPKTTLNVGMAAQDIGQLDPHFAVSTIDRVPAALDVQRPGAVRAGQHRSRRRWSRTSPRSWEATEDGKTWTFHLRHGVQFHGGFGELTADDVVFSLKKAGDAKTSAFASETAAVPDHRGGRSLHRPPGAEGQRAERARHPDQLCAGLHRVEEGGRAARRRLQAQPDRHRAVRLRLGHAEPVAGTGRPTTPISAARRRSRRSATASSRPTPRATSRSRTASST